MQEKSQEFIALSAKNNELENYFRNTIIPQLFIDADLILRKFTPPAMKQFDLRLTDVGRHINSIHDNFRYPSLEENIHAVMRTNEILQKEIQTTDSRWYQMNIIPYVQRENNKTNGVIITFVDITLRIKDLKELERLIADHETLLDMLTHDVRTPLTNLSLAIGELKTLSTNTHKDFATLLGISEKALSRMTTFIQNLTDNREKVHKYKTHPELLSFENILDDVRLTLADNIESTGAVISWNLQASELTFPRRNLRSILYNLLNNAIKYRSQARKPEIFIETSRTDDGFLLEVKDNGVGIRERDMETIFEKYFRVDYSLEGSGIGLHLVKSLVTNSGGTISVDSIVGEGSSFKVVLKDVTG